MIKNTELYLPGFFANQHDCSEDDNDDNKEADYPRCPLMSDVNNGHETYHAASRPA